MRGIVLAGGGGRRLGGVLKPVIPVAGVRMIDRVIAALTGCESIVVVGPAALDDHDGDASAPRRVVRTQETPPGGGPVAGIGAAFELLPAGGSAMNDRMINDAMINAALVAIVGGDLPLLTATDVTTLVTAVAEDADGSVYVDETGRPQWLCGVWRGEALAERLDTFGELANGSLRALFGPMRFVEVEAGNGGMPPFFDCDTEDDIRQAEEWLRR